MERPHGSEGRGGFYMLQLQRVYTHAHQFLTHEKHEYKNADNKVKNGKKKQNKCAFILRRKKKSQLKAAVFEECGDKTAPHAGRP